MQNFNGNVKIDGELLIGNVQVMDSITEAQTTASGKSIVNVNNVKADINFTSDPQTQLDAKLDKTSAAIAVNTITSATTPENSLIKSEGVALDIGNKMQILSLHSLVRPPFFYDGQNRPYSILLDKDMGWKPVSFVSDSQSGFMQVYLHPLLNLLYFCCDISTIRTGRVRLCSITLPLNTRMSHVAKTLIPAIASNSMEMAITLEITPRTSNDIYIDALSTCESNYEVWGDCLIPLIIQEEI